ncbi:MAG: hypothetical protein OXC94_08165 [Chloroflexi bacterium]|nr:hypothetical protein [Chloroflexota bacterium]
MPTPEEQSAGYDIFVEALAKVLLKYADGPKARQFVNDMDEQIGKPGGSDYEYFPTAVAQALLLQLKVAVLAEE